MIKQKIFTADFEFNKFDKYLRKLSIKRIMLVCGRSANKLPIWKYFQKNEKNFLFQVNLFSDFQPNPGFESVVKGVATFKRTNCDCLIAVGGGSAIDVAKCIKLYAGSQTDIFSVSDPYAVSSCPFIAIPTTAGSGSEATQFAVVYLNDEKKGISDTRCIPSAVLFDPIVLDFLPLYQKKATVLDALCHAIESFWSIHSTPESELYASKAIQLVLKNVNTYLMGDTSTYKSMFLAANFAGKAINITQTTAGHALSYKLTSNYGIAHGHAVAICVRPLWHLLLNYSQNCNDILEGKFISKSLEKLALPMGCSSAAGAAKIFDNLVESLELSNPHPSEDEITELSNSVNYQRLKNFPMNLSTEEIKKIYRVATKK